MAKESLQAVSDAEQIAAQTIKAAEEQGKKLIAEAKSKTNDLIAKAESEAHKKAGVLTGSADYEVKSIVKENQEKIDAEIESLESAANANKAAAKKAILEAVLKN